MTTSNERYTTSGIKVLGSNFHRADFVIFGTPNSPYFISVAAELEIEHENIPVEGLKFVDLTVFSSTVGAETTNGQIGADGRDIVFVGGALIVPPIATEGEYEGEVEMTVHY